MKKYLQKSLNANETVTLEANFHWIVYVIPAIVFCFFFFAACVTGKDGFAIYMGIGIVLTLLSLKPAFFNVMFSELAITNKKVVGKIGFINTKEMNSPLRQIQNVSSESKLLGKIFKYNTITIQTASGIYIFKYVKNGDDFKNTVMAQIENTEEDKMDSNAQKIADAINNTK